MTTISEVMSTDMVQVTPDTTVAEAATIMSTKKVGSALVMNGEIAGRHLHGTRRACGPWRPSSTPSTIRWERS